MSLFIFDSTFLNLTYSQTQAIKLIYDLNFETHSSPLLKLLTYILLYVSRCWYLLLNVVIKTRTKQLISVFSNWLAFQRYISWWSIISLKTWERSEKLFLFDPPGATPPGSSGQSPPPSGSRRVTQLNFHTPPVCSISQSVKHEPHSSPLRTNDRFGKDSIRGHLSPPQPLTQPFCPNHSGHLNSHHTHPVLPPGTRHCVRPAVLFCEATGDFATWSTRPDDHESPCVFRGAVL